MKACKILKNDPKTKDMFIIVFSGIVDKELPRKAKKAGADEFIEKPIKLEKLVEIIKNAIEKKRAVAYVDK